MNLTKEMKKAVIIGLMEQTVSKHGKAIVSATVALNKLWKAEFVRNAEIAYPMVPKETWKPLIQGGGGRSVSTKSNISRHKPSTGYPEHMAAIEVGKADIDFDRKTEDVGWHRVKNAIDAKWTGLVYNISCANGTFKVTTPLTFSDVLGSNRFLVIKEGEYALGKLKDPEQISWAQRAAPLVKRSEEISAKIVNVAKELYDYHQLLVDVMAPIRTLERLKEEFPEAVKFCPEPVAPKQQVTTTEKLDMARAILAKGIPNE